MIERETGYDTHEEPEVFPTCDFCDNDAAGICSQDGHKFCLDHGSVAARACFMGSTQVREASSRTLAQQKAPAIPPSASEPSFKSEVA